jgi:hypothetical protein
MTQDDMTLWDCFHDGDLVDVKKLDEFQTEFIIDIPYLSFHMFGEAIPFQVLVDSCNILQLSVIERGVEKNIVNLDEIKKLELEISSSKINDNLLEVFCYIPSYVFKNLNFDHQGVILELYYSLFRVFVGVREIGLSEILKGQESYWSDWSEGKEMPYGAFQIRPKNNNLE